MLCLQKNIILSTLHSFMHSVCVFVATYTVSCRCGYCSGLLCTSWMYTMRICIFTATCFGRLLRQSSNSFTIR